MDENILECKESLAEYAQELLTRNMEDAGRQLVKSVKVPGAADIVNNWAEKE